MESYGLAYSLTAVWKAGGKSDAPKFQHKGRYNASRSDGQKAPYTPGFRPQHGEDEGGAALQLDPAIDELVAYSLTDAELGGRHAVLSPELRHLIHTEQRKLSILIQVAQTSSHFSMGQLISPLSQANRQHLHEERDTARPSDSLFHKQQPQQAELLAAEGGGPMEEEYDPFEAECAEMSLIMGGAQTQQPVLPAAKGSSGSAVAPAASSDSASHQIMQRQIELASSSGKRQRSSAMSSFFTVSAAAS